MAIGLIFTISLAFLSWGTLARSAEISIDYQNNTFSKAFDFSGPKNVFKFMDLAQSYGLDVILRGLPYSCGEYTFGGIPPWILTRHPDVNLRQLDPIFMGYVNQWFSALLPQIKPYLAHFGGPIITVQVENEYGSWGACDKDYMRQLVSLMTHFLGPKTVLFTTDGDGQGFLKCGAIKEAYSTVDFGPGFGDNVFEPQRVYEPHGPLVNSEYYVGWLDNWGLRHSTTSAETAVKYLMKLLQMKANVNMYMFHGGTNFAFTNGANYPPFEPQPTSYDYDAPLSEAGDITHKYVAIAKAVRQFRRLPPVSFPRNTTKRSYGKMKMESLGTLTSLLPYLTTPQGPVNGEYPLKFEELGFYEGLVLYRTVIPKDFPANISLNVTVNDRGYVSLNGIPQGILSRMKPACQSINISQAKTGDTLEILVENQGRINYGYGMKGDFKGLVGNVTLNGTVLSNWTMFPVDFGRVAKLPHLLRHMPRERHSRLQNESRNEKGLPFSPARVLVGEVPSPQKDPGEPFMPDTFIDPSAWGKGLIFLNDINLGRYWPTKGPQVTLYAPGPYFRSGVIGNVILMVELERVARDFTIKLVDEPDLTGHLGTFNKEHQWQRYFKGGA